MQLNSISVMDLVALRGCSYWHNYRHFWNLKNGKIALLNMLIIILLSAEFFRPLRQLGSFFHIAMNGASAADKIFRILDIEHIENENKKYTHRKLQY